MNVGQRCTLAEPGAIFPALKSIGLEDAATLTAWAAFRKARGAQKIMAWFKAYPGRHKIDDNFDCLCDRIITAYQTAWPKEVSK